ncbi:helix-turn-helix domain-containing protein [Kitasatospora sp. NBC_01246]|uniref:helix-turn-helix domain-containing protein n=1 Tax=Kitasatospora sp. NBC_01246 TaxID=2903570 RepID=UPI002E37E0BE|nr:helix-turn-helix domain-containing protein [Kitasatospora sp. NBC_01246]
MTLAQNRGALPTLLHPADIAKALDVSEWWVKEQARRGRIPFTKPGRSYRFTAEQFAEILRLYESRPVLAPAPRPAGTEPAPSKPTRPPQPVEDPVRLRARVPRRAALHQQQDAA